MTMIMGLQIGLWALATLGQVFNASNRYRIQRYAIVCSILGNLVGAYLYVETDLLISVAQSLMAVVISCVAFVNRTKAVREEMEKAR
jgi:hypothetical protein